MFLAATAGTGTLVTLRIVFVAVDVLSAYPLVPIARQTSDCGDSAWFGWIPVLNTILMCRIARISAWSVLILRLGAVPGIGALVSIGYTIYLWVKIRQRFDRTGLAIGAAVIPVIGIWVFASKITPEAA
jgi:Family of unknown function (DUF5684)